MAQRGNRRWGRTPLAALAFLLVAGGLASTAAPASGAGMIGRDTVPTVEIGAAPSQTMEGFGASGAWWPNDLVRFPASVQEHVADLLFNPDGIGLSAYRFNIGGGGVGVTNPTRSVHTFLGGRGDFDWSADPGGMRFLRLARDHHVPILEGFANSAPQKWTSDHLSCGGQLTPGDERAYAAYLAEVVHHLAGADGIHLTYVSPMNEPDNSFGTCGQEGMGVPVSQRATVVKALGKALADRAPFAHVVADESSLATFQFLPEVPEWLSTPGTSKWVADLAHHTYEFPTDAQASMVSTLGPRFGKALWMTEICCYDGKGPLLGFGSQYDPTMTSGLWLADTIYQDVAVIGDAQFDWWTALSSQMGCSPVGDPSCATAVNGSGWNDGLLYYDGAYASDGNYSIYPSKRYYVLGNFSRYVRPGAVRHPVTGAPTGLRVLAFEERGDWSVLVVNDNGPGSAPVPVSIGFPKGVSAHPTAGVRTSATDSLTTVARPRMSDGVGTVVVPPQSVSTYTFGT